MDLFEFILIITSVIYAMAVAQILSGVSRLAQTDVAIRWFLPHTLWIASLFIWVILVWWSVWEFRSLQWTFPRYVFVFVPPTLVFFTCSLLIPKNLNNQDVDLEAHFLRVRRLFLGSFAVASIFAVFDGSILSDEPLWDTGRGGQIVLIVAALAGLATKNKRAQTLVAAIVMIALVYITIMRQWNPR